MPLYFSYSCFSNLEGPNLVDQICRKILEPEEHLVLVFVNLGHGAYVLVVPSGEERRFRKTLVLIICITF
jgi:hypothetical protein